MILKTVPAPIAATACVTCVSEAANWTGCWPSRVATMCNFHHAEWATETL